MGEVLYHRLGAFGPKLELHIAPEGLTLVGRGGRETVEYAAISDIGGLAVSKSGNRRSLSILFDGTRPSWTIPHLPSHTADLAVALIEEERSVSAKRRKAEYTSPMPLGSIGDGCVRAITTGNGHGAVDVVDFLLVQAVLHGASDVHFDPYADAVIVRYRLDGVLQDVARLESGIKDRLTSRLKVVSHLATFRKSVAQEGRAATRVGERTVDFRFSSIPTIHGEKVAVRIFDPAQSIFAIDDLGMKPEMVEAFRGMLLKPQGTILLTGPSSSGKTTTMYAALNYLRENRRNLSSIATVEDPVEYDLHTVNQTQVNASSGLTFANALRTVLRQDPEVIMIGEIRDQETADIAIQAGLTGHLVLSTVHARSAAGVLLRLVDLGVEPYLLASSVTAVLSQRLVRKVCKSCAKGYVPTSDERAKYSIRDGDTFQVGAGCEKCANTGYSGRTGLFQLLPVTEAMREMVLRRSALGELEEQVERERVASLVNDGVAKAKAGLTTLEELTRVLG